MLFLHYYPIIIILVTFGHERQQRADKLPTSNTVFSKASYFFKNCDCELRRSYFVLFKNVWTA